MVPALVSRALLAGKVLLRRWPVLLGLVGLAFPLHPESTATMVNSVPEKTTAAYDYRRIPVSYKSGRCLPLTLAGTSASMAGLRALPRWQNRRTCL